MREELRNLYRKVEINRIGEQTEWKEGYEQGLLDAIEHIENNIDSLIIANNNYFVIMYENNDKRFPYIEEMRMYKMTKGGGFCFSRDLCANRFNTSKADVVIKSKENIKKRIFFTREMAEKTISRKGL